MEDKISLSAVFMLFALSTTALGADKGRGRGCQVIYDESDCAACFDKNPLFQSSACLFICQWDADRNGEITEDELDAVLKRFGGVPFTRVEYEAQVRIVTGLCEDQVKEFANRRMAFGPDNPEEFGQDDQSAFFAMIEDEARKRQRVPPVPCQIDFIVNYRQFWLSVVNEVTCP